MQAISRIYTALARIRPSPLYLYSPFFYPWSPPATRSLHNLPRFIIYKRWDEWGAKERTAARRITTPRFCFTALYQRRRCCDKKVLTRARSRIRVLKSSRAPASGPRSGVPIKIRKYLIRTPSTSSLFFFFVCCFFSFRLFCPLSFSLSYSTEREREREAWTLAKSLNQPSRQALVPRAMITCACARRIDLCARVYKVSRE